VLQGQFWDRYFAGCTVRLTPPAIAALISPLTIDEHARWMAVRDEEHIVSTAILGP